MSVPTAQMGTHKTMAERHTGDTSSLCEECRVGGTRLGRAGGNDGALRVEAEPRPGQRAEELPSACAIVRL